MRLRWRFASWEAARKPTRRTALRGAWRHRPSSPRRPMRPLLRRGASRRLQPAWHVCRSRTPAWTRYAHGVSPHRPRAWRGAWPRRHRAWQASPQPRLLKNLQGWRGAWRRQLRRQGRPHRPAPGAWRRLLRRHGRPHRPAPGAWLRLQRRQGRPHRPPPGAWRLLQRRQAGPHRPPPGAWRLLQRQQARAHRPPRGAWRPPQPRSAPWRRLAANVPPPGFRSRPGTPPARQQRSDNATAPPAPAGFARCRYGAIRT